MQREQLKQQRGPIFILIYPRAKNISFYSFKSNKLKCTKSWAAAGQIESCHGPYLARGPYGVRACFKATVLNLFLLVDP